MSPGEVADTLKLIESHPREEVNMYVADFERIQKACGITPKRVIKNPQGKAMIIIIDKQKTIEALKSKFMFHSLGEVTTKLREAME